MSLFTIGCSIHTPQTFIANLKQHSIQAVVDCRSTPYSKITPHFNKESIHTLLKQHSISYLSFQHEFGARRKEPPAYQYGRVHFPFVIQLPQFQEGVQRIRVGLDKQLNIALMCTEKHPIDCHRFLLVSHHLEQVLQLQTQHILFDGSLLTTPQLESLMIDKLKLQPTLFEQSLIPLIEKAYTILGNNIAYIEQQTEPTN